MNLETSKAPSLRLYYIILSFQKILTMIPTEEEKQKIQEAQLANPEVPLGSAEQFLLTLSSISELSARLHLWAFKMDYETTEKVSSWEERQPDLHPQGWE